MARFSERQGYTTVSTALQVGDMSDVLRTSLWNVLDVQIWKRQYFLYPPGHRDTPEINPFTESLWFHFFKKPIDERPER
jgi:hypothetical protein